MESFSWGIFNPFDEKKFVLFEGPEAQFSIKRIKDKLELKGDQNCFLFKALSVPGSLAKPKNLLIGFKGKDKLNIRIYKKSFIYIRRKHGIKPPFLFCGAVRWDDGFKVKECGLVDQELLRAPRRGTIICQNQFFVKGDIPEPLGPLHPGKWRVFLGNISERFTKVQYFSKTQMNELEEGAWGPIVEVPEGGKVFVGPFKPSLSKTTIRIDGLLEGDPYKKKYGNVVFFAKLEVCRKKNGEPRGVILSLFHPPFAPIWKGVPPGKYRVSFGLYHPDVFPGFLRKGPILSVFSREEVEIIHQREVKRLTFRFPVLKNLLGCFNIHLGKFFQESKSNGKSKLLIRINLFGLGGYKKLFSGCSIAAASKDHAFVSGFLPGRYKIEIFKQKRGIHLPEKAIGEKVVVLRGGEIKDVYF